MFCVLHWEPNSPVSSWRLTSLCSLILKKHRFCGKSLIHRSHLNSARCVQSSPSNVKAGGLSPRRRKEPNMLLKTVTEVNWKYQPLSRRQCLRPKKMPLSVETKKSSLVPSTSAADKSTPDRSQPKTVEIQMSPPAKSLMDTATSPFPAKTRKLSISLTREEEEYYTKLTKLKMNESGNKSTVRCKIKGQPLIFKNVLKKNKITMQAYHGRTFVGNHCHKYPTICHT